MMKIVDMARTKAEKKARNEPTALLGESDDYSYGLQIRMDKDELSKLGIEELPAVGSDCYFYIACKVTRASQSADQGGESKGVELQITKMAIEEPPAEEKAEDARASRTPAERIYGKKK